MARRSRPSVTPFVVLLAGILLVGGFVVWRMLHPTIAPVARVSLVAVRYSDLPGWAEGDARKALAAFLRSCAALKTKAPASQAANGAFDATAGDWQTVCRHIPAASADARAARGFFESNFAPLEARSSAGARALFTGYYEPELFASRTRHGPYQAPIYGPPANLITADLGLFRTELQGERLYGCLDLHKLLPCPNRAQIDTNGMPDAPVLFYADDSVAVFFLHIQGSGRVRLDDGSMVRVSYAGQNGRQYKAIGRTLLEHNWIDRGSLSMQGIRAWLKTHAQQARAVMESDPSYVFFKEGPIGDPNLGSAGSEGVPLTPAGSAAVDPRIYPLGAPVYVTAMRPDADPDHAERPFRQLLIAQDTGGAIRGPLHADIFWGFGKDAESLAGRMKSRGRLFVLLPKAVVARLRSRELPVS
jgi:membrane-bound lytic murein transglycosylase A